MKTNDKTFTSRTPSIRVIPRLEIKGPNLVKGIQFEGLRVLGKPEHFARHYYESGADELIFVDVVASLYGRNSLLHLVQQISKQIFIPLTVGGGLRNVQDIRDVLEAGADKVCINTAAVKEPSFIQEAARHFGASTIIVGIDAMKLSNGKHEVCVEHGRERTSLDAVEWAIQACELGAGEILITSINQDGTGKGFDIELTKNISAAVSIPVTAGGGAGDIPQILDVAQRGRINALALASVLHYNLVRNGVFEIEEAEEGNTEFLTGKRGSAGLSSIKDLTLPEIKRHLYASGINCRHEP